MTSPIQKSFFYTPSLRFRHRLIVAPMAGISDLPFRKTARILGADCCYSEMISADAIVRKNKNTLEHVKSLKGEPSLIVQLFGADPHILAEAAYVCEAFGLSMLDINMGCPVKKVFKKGAGAALLSDIKRVRAIIKEVRKKISIPLSIKIRAGVNLKRINAKEVAIAAQDEGVNMIAVHPRTRDQFFSANADWSIIGEVKQAVSVPIVGNGDIKNSRDAVNMINYTGCDLVMAGRSLRGNPWLIGEIISDRGFDEKEKRTIIKRHVRFTIEEYGETRGIKVMRKHLLWYIKGSYGAASLRRDVSSAVSLHEINNILERLTGDGFTQ